MLVTHVHITPLDTGTGSRVNIYATSANDRRVTGLNGVTWEPALVTPPAIGMSLWNGDFGSSVDPGAAAIPINMAVMRKSWPSVDAYAWIGASVRIYLGEAGDAWPWDKVFSGTVTGFSARGSILTVQAKVDDEVFKENVLYHTYAGTGGAEGPADLKNRPKPLVFGHAKNVEPVLIDPTNYVYQFSGYGAIEGVTTLYERASSFAASTGDHASYAALVAATIDEGTWATCLAEGMIRLGAPVYGVITGDIKGHVIGSATPRLTGEIILGLSDMIGIASANIDLTSFGDLDTDKPYPVNIVLSEQETFIDFARRMALPCNWQVGVSLAGILFATKPDLGGTPVFDLNAQGRALPQVAVAEEVDVSPPYSKTSMGANRAWRVHTSNEISFVATLVYRGLYDAATMYREGDWVDLADGSTWLYTNPTPTKGNAPPTWPTASNSWWENRTPPSTQSTPLTIRAAAVKNPRDGSDVARSLLIASDAGATATISVAKHDWDYPGETADVTRALGTITGLAFDTLYYVYFDDSTLTNTTPTYAATTTASSGQNSAANPSRHPVGAIRTPKDGGSNGESNVGPNYGYGGAPEAILNFGNRLERLATTPPVATIAADGSAVEHNASKLGVDLRFAWTLSAANEALIHGFEVMLYQSTSSGAYTPGATPLLEQRTLVGPKTRGLVAFVGDAAAYYTWAIRTYRNVDTDIDATGRIYSAWVKPSLAGENPYRPSTSAELADSVKIGSGGNTAANVSTWAGYASNGLNSDGSVKDDKVGTAALIDESLIKAGWAVQTATTGITNETYDMNFGSPIATSGPRLVVRGTLIWRLAVTNPTQDAEWSFDVKGLLVQTVSPFITYTVQTQTLTYKWLWSSRTGTFYTEKRSAAFEWVVDGQSASTYQAGMRFVVPSGFTVEIVGAHYLKIDDIKVVQ